MSLIGDGRLGDDANFLGLALDDREGGVAELLLELQQALFQAALAQLHQDLERVAVLAGVLD